MGYYVERQGTIMDKNIKVAVIGTTATLLIIAVILAAVLIKKFTPNKEIMGLNEYYDIPAGEAMIIIEDAIYQKNALIIDEEVYIDLDTVKTYYNKRFYWDSYENMLLYATPNELIKAENGSTTYYVNKNKSSMKCPIVKTFGDKVYIAAEFIKLYSGFEYTLYSEPYRVLMNGTYGRFIYMDVAKATQIRVEPDIKSFVLKELLAGDKLMLIEDGGTQKNGFIKVMTADGVRGYAKKTQLTSTYNIIKEDSYKWPEYAHTLKNEKINLSWHQITNIDANNNFSSLLSNVKGLNVISPTWFRINSVDGTLSSFADSKYVDTAHGMEIEVWGLIDNFDKSIDTFEVLSRTSRRERLINEIISEAIKYKLDGINIDFEELSLETGPHYIQFLRELSIKCRSNNIILSVDNYVPASYNKFYDLLEQGVVVDYVIIMAYDEHYSGSTTEGSVSSLPFVSAAIVNALEMVPAEQLVIAVPFYTRLWKKTSEDGQDKLTSEALGMKNAEDVLVKNDVTAEWLDEAGQYYAEYEKDGYMYYIWLEGEESIEAKVKLIYDANLAGIASWRLGFEKAEIWDIILKYIN